VDLDAGKAPEIARRHHIGLGTVRWHLKSILAKTGTTRQAEAVALLARSVAALSSPNRDLSMGRGLPRQLPQKTYATDDLQIVLRSSI